MSEATMANQSTRLQGILILLAIIAPMILAYIIFHTGVGVPGSTTNKGDLLTAPQSIETLQLQQGDQALANLYRTSEKRWRILVPVSADCPQSCQQFLYLSRQVHIRLAQKAYRVERILLLLNELSVEEMETLREEHPETLMVESSQSSLEQWLATNNLPQPVDNYFYLLDQEGFAMMRYGTNHQGQDVLDDLKKLLKFTYDK